MPDSVDRLKKSGAHGFQPDPRPSQVHATHSQHGHHPPEGNRQGGEWDRDCDLDRDVSSSPKPLKEGPLQGSAPQSFDESSLPSFSMASVSVFGHGQETIAKVRDLLVAATHVGSRANLSGFPRHLVAAPELPELPVALRPWAGTLKGWGKTTELAKKKLPFTDGPWMREHQVSISGPTLPMEYCPWFISVGIDPGPQKTDLGHTCLLLVAAPEVWTPSLQGVLHGPYGEQLVVRLDSLLMKVTQAWWDAFAYGALATGALYFIAPESSE